MATEDEEDASREPIDVCAGESHSSTSTFEYNEDVLVLKEFFFVAPAARRPRWSALVGPARAR